MERGCEPRARDVNSAAFISFIGSGTNPRLHPDFGGINPDEVNGIYGIPYIVVDSTQPKKAVLFQYSDESDGVDHNTDTSFPFYPIPDEAITQAHWIEGGPPGNQNVGGDRHMLIVDKDNKHLYELFDLFHNGSQWTAGSGAFFDMKTNDRRPEGWTSADAAGLAILPGLVRYDEVFGPDEIAHALRFTVNRTKGYVFPASHQANTSTDNNALPMGARLRLKASKDISGFPPSAQKIFRAMKKYGLILADNGSNMYISGAFNTQWDNGILNPAFHALRANDFEVIQLGYNPPSPPSLTPPTVTTTAAASITTSTATLNATINPNGLSTTGSFQYGVTTGYGLSTAGTSLGSGIAAVPLNAPVAGLACNTLYHFRATATNAGGTTNGGGLTFTTAACAPSVTSGPALNVSTTTADLSGNVTSDGGAPITERGFVSSVTGNNPDPAIGGPSVTKTVVAGTTGAFSMTLSSLTPSSGYSFKAYAINSAGTTYSPVLTFTTSDPAAPEALVARVLSVDSASRATLSIAASQVWYRVQLFANRSYQVSAWPVDHEQGVDAAKLTATVFSDNLGIVQANGLTGVSGTIEGSPNQGGDDKPFTATIQPTTSGVYKIRVLRVAGGAVPHSVNVMLRETTLFSPWTSRAAGFEGFIEMRNNTNAAVHVTLRAFDSTGVQQGAGATITLQPNATDFRTATQVGVPVNVFAGIVLTHDGALGAVSANITTLNGAIGLSFDSPFTGRAGGLQGLPIR